MNATSIGHDAEIAPRPMTGGAVMSAASRIWITIAAGITTILFARILGPHGYGGYSIAGTLAAVLAAAATLGVDQGIAYFVGARRWEPRAALGSAMLTAAVAGTLGIAVGLAARAAFPSAFDGLPFWLTVLALVAVPFSLALAFVSSIALATDRYEAAMSLPAAQAALLLVVGIPAALWLGRTGAVAALTTATVVAAVGGVVWALRRLPPAGSAPPGQLRRAISFGIKGYGANTLQLVNYQLDLFILAAVAPAAAVGHYALAVSGTTLLLLLPRALSAVLYPRVARLSIGGQEGTLEMVETRSVRHASLIVIVSSLGMAAALELLVVPVFGADYRATINLGLLLIPGAAALGIASVLAATFVGRGHAVYSLYGALVTTPLTILLYVTLIPWLQATGAALASTISYLAGFLLVCWFYRRSTGRRVAPLLVPGRAELDDLLALARSARRRGDRR